MTNRLCVQEKPSRSLWGVSCAHFQVPSQFENGSERPWEVNSSNLCFRFYLRILFVSWNHRCRQKLAVWKSHFTILFSANFRNNCGKTFVNDLCIFLLDSNRSSKANSEPEIPYWEVPPSEQPFQITTSVAPPKRFRNRPKPRPRRNYRKWDREKWNSKLVDLASFTFTHFE